MADKIPTLFTARIATAETKLINLNPEPVKAKVVREGYTVPVAEVNPARKDFFIDNLQLVDIRTEPRVVSQTVPRGTKVLPGTSIDLVLARTSDIPLDIFELPHRDLRQRNVASVVEGLLADTGVREALLQFDTPDKLPVAQKAALTASFARNGITVNEDSADTGFEAAFNTARSALAFR